MVMLPRRRTASVRLCAVLILGLFAGTIGASGMAKAEIPHENYDLANPNLDTVINLLNTSIRASEGALEDFYNQSMASADEYLAMVDGILAPANQVLSKIENVAGSYEDLSDLLPPFLHLRSQMGSFSDLETDLMDARTLLTSLKDLDNMSDAKLVEALKIVSTIFSLTERMNSTIDVMLVSAGTITGMVVSEKTPFAPNSLRPLIEKLRDMLNQTIAEIEPIIHNDVPWGPERSFLLLWVENTTVYLGERIVGGGYLYYNGSFRANHLVHVLWDGKEIIGTTTRQNGTYSFAIRLEINASFLGQHTMTATAVTPYTQLYSDNITITVLLVPTVLTFELDRDDMNINETTRATIALEDVHGQAIPGAECLIEVSGRSHATTTDANGRSALSFTGAQLGFGLHSFTATYSGVLPYASSAAGPLSLEISVPTHLELELFADRFMPGYKILGSGKLLANLSQPLAHQKIALFVDDTLVMNVTTDAQAEFAIYLPSTNLSAGTHTLRAAFMEHGTIWRYCDASVVFAMTKLRQGGYPFFPFFPGWNMGPDETIPYLFFGPYAYYFWLLMLAVLAMMVKTLQARKARVAAPKRDTVAIPIAEGASGGALAAGVSPTDAYNDWPTYEGPRDPNGRIVWLYNLLLEFLQRKRRVTITEDMTHWEVARLLRTLGYPKESVERVTVLFERAFYSGAALTDVDSVRMSVEIDGIRTGGVETAQ